MTITFDQLKETIKDGHVNWRDLLDDRQQKEVEFSKIYAYGFAHGTEGHNAKLIIAKMADMLDSMSQNITIEVTAE